MNCLSLVSFFVFRAVTTFLVSIERAFYEDYDGMVKILIYNAQNILPGFFWQLHNLVNHLIYLNLISKSYFKLNTKRSTLNYEFELNALNYDIPA